MGNQKKNDKACSHILYDENKLFAVKVYQMKFA